VLGAGCFDRLHFLFRVFGDTHTGIFVEGTTF
jgi:hypothetical protein